MNFVNFQTSGWFETGAAPCKTPGDWPRAFA